MNAYILFLLSLIYMGELLDITVNQCGEEAGVCYKNTEEAAPGCKDVEKVGCSIPLKTDGKPGNCPDSQNESATCINCPLNYISTFQESFMISIISKPISKEYSTYTDHLFSRYSPDTWKPPDFLT